VPAYLDHAASTPAHPEVLEAMLPWLSGPTANPTGSHRAARAARRAIDEARDTLADTLGVESDEIVFTSGGTESDNLAVFGALEAFVPPVGHHGAPVAVCSAIEHPAVLEPVERTGGRVVGVHPSGVVDLDALAAMLDPTVALLSVMAVNNEVGTVQPVIDVAELARELAPNAVVHTDAVQAFTWLDLAPVAAAVDTLALSGHKIGGPKGVGALVWRRGARLTARQWGGAQERGRRSGTQNTAGIVGLAVAAGLTAARRDQTRAEMSKQRDRLVEGILRETSAVEAGVIDGDRSHKVAGSAHLCFPGVEAEALLFLLDQAGVAASAASSCASGAQEPSHVLAAMGVDRSTAGGSLRLSLGWSTTDDEVDDAITAVTTAVERLRRTGS
jgi:cysteine desulfurase